MNKGTICDLVFDIMLAKTLGYSDEYILNKLKVKEKVK